MVSRNRGRYGRYGRHGGRKGNCQNGDQVDIGVGIVNICVDMGRNSKKTLF